MRLLRLFLSWKLSRSLLILLEFILLLILLRYWILGNLMKQRL